MGGALSGRMRRAAGTAVAVKAPLNASAVTATAAATATAASTRQRLRTHSLIVVARTRPHDGAAAAGLAEYGTGFPVSLVGSPAPSSVPTFTSMLPSGARPLSSSSVATLRPHVSATHLPQQSTPACQDQPKTPIGNECIAQPAEACASFACLRNHFRYGERQSASCAELEALIPRRRSDLRCRARPEDAADQAELWLHIVTRDRGKSWRSPARPSRAAAMGQAGVPPTRSRGRRASPSGSAHPYRRGPSQAPQRGPDPPG